MFPWGSPGGSLEGPWGAPGASGERSGPLLEKSPKSLEKLKCAGSLKVSILGPGWDPKIDRTRAWGRKSASGDGAGIAFLGFLVLLLFGVSLWTDFWRV